MNAPIVAVTVLEDRASVTRRGSISLAAGQHRIVIERVSPVLVDKTLTAIGTGAKVLDVRCERYLAPWRDPAHGTAEQTRAAVIDRHPAAEQGGPTPHGEGPPLAGPAVLRSERTRLEGVRDAALALAASARVEIEALHELVTASHHDLAIAASRGTTAPTAALQLAELDAQEAAARARRVDAELEAQLTSTALSRLEIRISRAEAEAGEEAARLLIDVIAEAATDLALSINYVVPGAAWRPYHRAVLARAAGRVDWTTTACVWQSTGEDWIDTEVTFSLERPSLGVDPPDLADDEVRTRRRPDTVVVEAREQEQQSTGLGGGPAQVPGIDDGGLGVTLTSAKTSIKKDGMPHRVPVGGFTAPTQLSLVAIPLRSPWVHVRARIINAGTQPLLAGPVDLIMASGYVGRAEVGFVAAGEKFHLGFGPEADVRVHRTETSERDEAGLLGGANVQTVRVAVRLSNLGTERREINVTERIPISEVEQVDVKISSPDAYLLGADDQPGGEDITQVTARTLDDNGLVTWGVELPPLGRRAVTLEYRIKSQRGVAGV